MTDWHRVHKEAEVLANESYTDKIPDRRLLAGLVFAPCDIELDGDRLLWSAEGARYKRPKESMLDDFIALNDPDAPDPAGAVLYYARRWGVLGLCKHGLPASHNQGVPVSHFPHPYTGGTKEGILPCMPELVTPLPRDIRSPACYWEPVSGWRHWAQRAKHILSAAAKIRCSSRPTAEETRSLSNDLDEWLALGQVRPRITWSWSAHGWRYSLDSITTGPNLFGILGTYLSAQISTGVLAICTNCLQPYRAKRHPDPNRRNYCQECGRRVALRDAQRAHRDAQRTHRKLQKSD